MKQVVLSIMITASLVAFGNTRKGPSPEAIEQGKKNMEKIRTKLGGFIGDKRNAEGMISVIDAQSIVKPDEIKARVQRIEDNLMMVFKYSNYDGGNVDFTNLEAAKKSAPGNLWVVLTENEAMPNLVSLPEQRTVLINVAALAKDKPSEKILNSRVAKELSRAVCFAFVVRYSSTPGGVMDPMETMKDLDTVLVEQFGVDCIANIDREARIHYGIKRFPRKTYLDACKEGWAPAPTNEYQKAIWDKVHSMPTNPMKIKFDPKAKQ